MTNTTTTTRKLFVEVVSLGGQKVKQELVGLEGVGNKLVGTLQSIGTGPAAAIGVLTAGVGLLVKGFQELKAAYDPMVASAVEADRIHAQLKATLESTGYAAGLSADELDRHANAISRATSVTDDHVTRVQSLLLTYGKIGEDTFPRATEAIVDMATKLDKGLIPSTGRLDAVTKQLGKALEDPIRGITQLRKVGLNFDATEQQMIKTMVSHNNVAGAQAIILDKLEEKFGGSGAAALDTYEGELKQVTKAVDELEESMGKMWTQSDAIRNVLHLLSDDLFNITLDINAGTLAIDAFALAAADGAIALAKMQRFYFDPLGVIPGSGNIVDQLERYRDELAAGTRKDVVDFALGRAGVASRGSGSSGSGDGLGVPGGTGGKKGKYSYPDGFSGWEDQSGMVKKAVLQIRGALIHAGIQSAMNIIGITGPGGWLNRPSFQDLDGLAAAATVAGPGVAAMLRGQAARGRAFGAGGDIASIFNVRNGQMRRGNQLLDREETMRQLYGPPQVDWSNWSATPKTFDFDTGQWVETGPDFNRRSIYHRQNKMNYLQAALNGDTGGLGGLIGAGYGPGWGMVGQLGGGILKRGIEGLGSLLGFGGGDKPKVENGKVFVHDEQLGEVKELIGEMLNETKMLRLRGSAAGIGDAMKHVEMQRMRAGNRRLTRAL